jgi:hypothetical protein
MKIGNHLKKSFIVVPEEKKNDYVEVLLLVGDSFQKYDYIYDAFDFYQMALDVDPESLGTLLRIRSHFERLSEDDKIYHLNNRIDGLLTPRREVIKNSPIPKGSLYSKDLIMDGRKINLVLQFNNQEENFFPLISVFFNGRIIWEGYLEGSRLSLFLETRGGRNALIISSVNRSVDLIGLSWDTAL